MVNLANHIAAHQMEDACEGRAGVIGFRAWCTCGWGSAALPGSEVEFGMESPSAIAAHDKHVADAWHETTDLEEATDG